MRATSSGGAPAHGLAASIARPEYGSTLPPSSTMRNQSVSLNCWLSARSPVVSAKSSLARRPRRSRTGLRRLALTLRTTASNVCSANASCGRWEDFSAPPAGSTKSTRAGDISSTICGSVSWAKNATERRRAARWCMTFALPPRRTTYGSPSARSSDTKPVPEPGSTVSRSVVRPVGSAEEAGASASRASTAAAGRRRRIGASCQKPGRRLQVDLLRLDRAGAPGLVRRDPDRQVLDRQPGAVEQRHGVGIKTAGRRPGEHRAELGYRLARHHAGRDRAGQLATVPRLLPLVAEQRTARDRVDARLR